MIQTLLPTKIVKSKNLVNAKALKQKKPLQVVLRNDDAWRSQNAVFTGKGYVILDFGKEMNGGVRIITGGFAGQMREQKDAPNVRIRFGESLSETCAEFGEDGLTLDHGSRDITLILPAYANVTAGNTGFRFVRIDYLTDDIPVIQNVFCENNILNKKAVYTYNGNDKLVKKIFSVAKRTVDLCSAGDYVWDGIKRDRLVWIGDMHPEMSSLVTLYGRVKNVENSLDFVREQTPINLWMNGISSYSMWWMITVCDYYFETGEKAFAERQLDYFNGLIKRFDECVDQDGNMQYGWLFVDWPSCDSGDESAGVRAINVIALKKAIQLFDEFSLDTSLAKKVLDKLNKQPIKVNKMKQIIFLIKRILCDDLVDLAVIDGKPLLRAPVA